MTPNRQFRNSQLYRWELGTADFGLPRIVWAREQGWLNVQDPTDGTWFSILAKDAPTGWPRIASATKRQSL